MQGGRAHQTSRQENGYGSKQESKRHKRVPGVKHEQEGIWEIDDAKCKMGTMDIKLDKDFSVILISRY